MARRAVRVVCSLDVEEEGLFRGRYPVASPQTANLEHLHKLSGIMALGARPTLFCAYTVFDSDRAWQACEALAGASRARAGDEAACEIGCHLHHWNTPPFASEASCLDSVPSCELAPELMQAKLHTLFERARDRLGYRPTSFRMGRWDVRQRHWPLLAEAGILADASVRPLHAENAGHTRPSHFHAPLGPYRIAAGGKTIVEFPLTCAPLFPGLPWLATRGPRALYHAFHQWGVLALLPVYHPLWAMQAATLAHLASGDAAISLTWHSSEMMPGGNPRLPTEAAVQGLLAKIRRYLSWLTSKYDVAFLTLGEFAREAGPGLPVAFAEEDADWATPRTAPKPS